MEILVAVLVIAVIAAVAFAVMQRRSAGHRGDRSTPAGRRGRGAVQRDPMAAAVAEHVYATDPQDVVVAQQRLQAQASQIAAGLTADAHRDMAAEHQRAADQVGHDEPYAADPRGNGYVDPAADPGYAQPRADGDSPYGGAGVPDGYEDSRYDGRRAEDRVDPRYDDRAR